MAQDENSLSHSADHGRSASRNRHQTLPGSVLEQIPAWSFYVPLLANKGDPSQIRGLVFHTAIDETPPRSMKEIETMTNGLIPNSFGPISCS